MRIVGCQTTYLPRGHPVRTRSIDLTPAQAAALAHVQAGAMARTAQAMERIEAAGVDPADVADLAEAVRDHGRITLNFHPDRLVADGRSVAECLLADGIYRGQWETGISNGGRTAFPGGDRDGWERILFGEAYHDGDVRPADRPKYGGLNLAGHADGASPRFGSCHVRLHPAANGRATFTVGDSALRPTDLGTVDALACVLAGLLERAAETGETLGLAARDPIELLASLATRPVAATWSAAGSRARRLYRGPGARPDRSCRRCRGGRGRPEFCRYAHR